jgi:transposase
MTNLMILIQDRLKVRSLKSWLNLKQTEGLSCRDIAELVKDETGITVSKSVVHNWITDVTPSSKTKK